MHQHFSARAIAPYVAPGAVISEFVFTNLDRGVKAVNVALLGRARLTWRDSAG